MSKEVRLPFPFHGLYEADLQNSRITHTHTVSVCAMTALLLPPLLCSVNKDNSCNTELQYYISCCSLDPDCCSVPVSPFIRILSNDFLCCVLLWSYSSLKLGKQSSTSFRGKSMKCRLSEWCISMNSSSCCSVGSNKKNVPFLSLWPLHTAWPQGPR